MSTTTSDCVLTHERLPAYVDGTLDAAQGEGLQHHLTVCPPCRAAEALERGGRAVLSAYASTLTPTPLPPGLRTRCEALSRELTMTPAMPVWRTRFVPLAFAVLLMVFFASAFVSLATHRPDGLMAAQLGEDHARCFQRFAGAISADAPEMERMFADRYSWSVRVPPSSLPNGVQLIGAKRCYYDGAAVPHILYRVNGEEMSLYVLDGTARPPSDLVSGGRRSRVWSRGDRTFVLISPVSAGEMAMAAKYVMEAH